MRFVTPKVSLLGRTQLNPVGVEEFLRESYGAEDWFENRYWMPPHDATDPEILIELYGRLCYDSYSAEGGNPNVTRIRTDRIEYLQNLIRSGHGSVLEHAFFNFGIRNTSVVMTQELIRHRVGTAISQESGRYVRPTELEFVADPDLLEPDDREDLEEQFRVYERKVARYDWDNIPFSKKKELTSHLRRFLPMGRATHIGWSGNIRSLRHIIDMRTSPHAEWEIRFVFGQVFDIMLQESVALFQDLQKGDQ